MRVEFLAEAETEFLESVLYYESQQIGLGERFSRSFWEGVARIVDFPEAAQEIDHSIRRYRMPDFPFGIVYVRRDNLILIVAVIHLHRKPGYWKSRDMSERRGT